MPPVWSRGTRKRSNRSTATAATTKIGRVGRFLDNELLTYLRYRGRHFAGTADKRNKVATSRLAGTSRSTCEWQRRRKGSRLPEVARKCARAHFGNVKKTRKSIALSWQSDRVTSNVSAWQMQSLMGGRMLGVSGMNHFPQKRASRTESF